MPIFGVIYTGTGLLHILLEGQIYFSNNILPSKDLELVTLYTVLIINSVFFRKLGLAFNHEYFFEFFIKFKDPGAVLETACHEDSENVIDFYD